MDKNTMYTHLYQHLNQASSLEAQTVAPPPLLWSIHRTGGWNKIPVVSFTRFCCKQLDTYLAGLAYAFQC